MIELLVLAAAAYVLFQPRSAGGQIPPITKHLAPQQVPTMGKPNTRTYGEDTMTETFDKGLNIKSYQNSIYITNGNVHYEDVARRERGKNIQSLEDVYRDYASQVNKKQNLTGHIWKKGKVSFGYPDRVNTAGDIPWFIVPFIPKQRESPLSHQDGAMFLIR
jgi:hypothetical protein